MRRSGNPLTLLGRGGWVGFTGLTAYLCYQVFVTLFGIGGEFGWGDNSRLIPGVTTFANHKQFAWGGHLVQLRKGQVVRVSYDATISRGLLKAQIYSRYRPGGPDAYSAAITQSGEGTVDIIAPADGWFGVRMRSQNTLSPAEIRARPTLSPREASTESRYSMVWRAIG